MKGYNLPDNVSPSDPDAPWNEEEEDWEPVFICQVCRREFESIDDEEACTHICEENS